jgi:hypothetical protein
LREKHGKKRKGWLKMHIAVDVKSKKLVGLRITDEKVGDNSEFTNLLGQVLKAGKPLKVLADSAYDSRNNYNLLSNLGIIPAIKPRTVTTAPKGWKELRERKKLGIKSRGSLVRKRNVMEYSLNPSLWKKKAGYGKRWSAEIVFSSFKRMFGEWVRARKFENMVKEIEVKAMVYNLFVSL